MEKVSNGIAGKIATFLGIPLASIAGCLLIVGQYREKVDTLTSSFDKQKIEQVELVKDYNEYKMKTLLMESRVGYLASNLDNLSAWKSATSETLVQIKSDLNSQNKILLEIRDDLKTLKQKP